MATERPIPTDPQLLGEVHGILAGRNPLYGLVADVDRSRSFLRVGAPGLLAEAEVSARQTLGQNEQYLRVSNSIDAQGQSLPDRKPLADQAIRSYTDFLVGDALDTSKAFVTSDQFQIYISGQATAKEVGPYFTKLLEVIKSDDSLLSHGHDQLLPIFAELDHNYFWLETVINPPEEMNEVDRFFLGKTATISSEADIPAVAKEIGLRLVAAINGGSDKTDKRATELAFETFKLANEELIDALTDTEHPNWQRLVQTYFPHFYKLIRFENNEYSYITDFRPASIERAKDLTQGLDKIGSPTDEDFDFLMSYINLSTVYFPKKTSKAFDEQIKRGEFGPAKALIEFYRKAFYEKKDSEFMPGETWAVKELYEGYVTGKVPSDRLDMAPQVWDQLREAYGSLPENLRLGLKRYPESERKRHATSLRYTMTLYDNWSTLLISPLAVNHPDTIAGIIASGMGPTKKRIEKLSRRPEVLAAAREFGSQLFPLAGLLPVGDTGGHPDQINANRLIEHWIDQVLRRKINSRVLSEVPGAILPIAEAAVQMYQNSGISERLQESLQKGLAEGVFRSLDHLKDRDYIVALLSNGIFPFPSFINHLKEAGLDGISYLEELQKLTSSGRFDPKNRLQRQLEYIKYLELTESRLQNLESAENFDLPFKADNSQGVELTYEEAAEGDAAAYEAAKLHQFLEGRTALGRRVAVVGNERYGANFVTEPLRSWFDDSGILYHTYYIHSGGGGNDRKTLAQVPSSIDAWIKTQAIDDVVIVDGTRNSFEGNTPRLPGALSAYGELLGKLGYRIAHWVPDPSDKIIVEGKQNYTPPTNETPQIILANPVMKPGSSKSLPAEFEYHKPGYFDDPTDQTKQEVVFTRRGVEELIQGKTEQELVQLAQRHIESVLPRYIRGY